MLRIDQTEGEDAILAVISVLTDKQRVVLQSVFTVL